MLRILCLALLVLVLPLPAIADEGTQTTSYDVAALLSTMREPSRDVLGLPPSSSHLFWAASDADSEETPSFFVEEDLLVELVVSAAASVLESDEGASVEMVGSRLVVEGPAALHVAAQEVLGMLWREASRRLAVTGTHLRFDAAGRQKLAAAGLLAALESGRLGAGQRDALITAAGPGRASSASAQVAPGRRAVIGRIDATSYVREYDVEIAQDSRVGDPRVDTVNAGWLLDVRPYTLQGGGVFVEVLGQAAALDQPIRQLPLEAEPFGTLELPVCAVWRFATAAYLPTSETFAVHALTADGGVEVFLLRAEPRGTRRRPGGIRRYDVSALTAMPFPWRLTEDEQPVPHTGSLLPPAFQRLEEAEPLVEGDALVDEISLRFGPGAWERDGAWLLGSEGALLAANDEAILEAIGEVVRGKEEALRTHRVTLRLLRIEGDARRVLTEASLDVPGNRAVAWQAGTERAYVADWDVEVAQEARAGDPQTSTVFSGLAMNLELEPAPLAGAAALAIDATWTRVDPTLRVRKDENDCTGVVEIPRLSRMLVTQDLVVHAGEPTRVPVGRLPDGASVVLEVVLAP